jgi:hypothetical protein
VDLTPLGAQVAQMGDREKQAHGQKLVKGGDINKYTKGVCYDTAAFVRFALGAKISPKEIESTTGQAWVSKFGFLKGKQWDGKSALKAGNAVGFYRIADKKMFHAAIATGGSKVRAVNGGKLGAGWKEVDLKKELGKPDQDGSFDHDRTKIQVWISKL